MSSCNPPIQFFPHLVIIATCIKLLTMQTYKSTDLDVHRNWLSITYSRPISQWYAESTSQWTLDYPPLFAYFQYLMSLAAVRFDPELVRISAERIRSSNVIYFQCVTVILSDFVYYYAVYRWIRFMSRESACSTPFRHKCSLYWIRSLRKDVDDETRDWFDPRLLLSVLFIFSPGLLIVDHIHFQYNGFLSGIFLLSILFIMQGDFLMGSIMFAILLHLKHIYLYVAPAFFVYILRKHCLDMHMNIRIRNLVKVAACVIIVSLVSIGPFVHQLAQLKTRLFPFKRGLTHAYWAPNVWAVYNAADWIMAKILFRKSETPAYMTGVVQEFDHLLLPSISPLVTLLVTIVALVPVLVVLWQRCHFTANPNILFLRSVVLCSLSAFLFSWHVHEKAILMPILPLTLLAILSHEDARIWIIASVAGTVALFPLLITTAETPVKIFLTLAYFAYAVPAFAFHDKILGSPILSNTSSYSSILSKKERLYLLAFVLLQAFVSLLLPLSGIQSRLPFLPLAITSLYSAIGIIVCYVRFYRAILFVK